MSGCGFGDGNNIDEHLANYEAWVHTRANTMLPPDTLSLAAMDRDDLAQTGLVAMWKALDTYDPDKGSLPSWLTMKADGAMKDALRPAPTKRQSSDSLEALLTARAGSPDVDLTPEALIALPDLLDGIAKAYHCGEVAKALDVLTPKQREYVRLRFWEGMGTKELTVHFGYDPSGLWNSKKNGAKYKMREALAHLAPV